MSCSEWCLPVELVSLFVAESLDEIFSTKDRFMKKILGIAIVALAFTSCGNGETGQREVEMVDNAVSAPTTAPHNNMTKDSSTGLDVRDTSTTVGYDTSAARKN